MLINCVERDGLPINFFFFPTKKTYMAATIFVQIASYRDPQLVPTVEDMCRQAEHPENLFFGIAWQHGPEETLPETWFSHPNFSILDIPYTESQGACWARNALQQRYRGQTYTLQLDSHHRFVQGWDRKLIRWLQRLQRQGFPKPMLTTYLPAFDPDNDPAARGKKPSGLAFDCFTPQGILLLQPEKWREWRQLDNPVPARFYSAHFCFTLGSFCIEVPHDPDLYFHGEEISIAVRAYTHGYDLFHPHRVVAWHEYTRKNRVKHWEEKEDWRSKDTQSHRRVRALLGMGMGMDAVDISEGGLGTVRTLQEYETYARLSFAQRKVQSPWP